MAAPQKIALERGPLRFTARSLGHGPLILCLHGFPDDAGSYRHQLPAFAAAGYRAVSVTLRGYEPSSQPADGDYTMEALAGDVVAFLDGLGAERAHLIGHDWGAAIAYAAGSATPERFASLTAMAVPHAGRFVNEAIRHPKQLRMSWYMAFFQLRGLAERVVARRGHRFIQRLWRAWSPGWDLPEEALRDVVATFEQPGVTRAALAYYRAALAPRAFAPSARAANRYPVPVPTLAITGARDGCIDTDVFQAMMVEDDFPAGLEVHQIADAGHFLHQEQPQAVNTLILDWIARWDDRTRSAT